MYSLQNQGGQLFQLTPNQGNGQEQLQIQCQRATCQQNLITKVCLFKDCKQNNRLVCDSENCWRDHVDHMNKVVVIQTALQQWSQLQDACRTLQQDYNETIERKKKEFIVSLEGEIKIRDTPIFKALDGKPAQVSYWKTSDLNSYVSNLAQIDTSQPEFKDVQANQKIDKLKNMNIGEGIKRIYNGGPPQNLSFAANSAPPPRFQPQNVQQTAIINPPPTSLPIQIQPQPRQLLQTEFIQLQQNSQVQQIVNNPQQHNQDDDLKITLDLIPTSHRNLAFNKAYAYQGFKVLNNNRKIQLQMGMDKLAVLPQNLMQMSENIIQLVIEYQGGTFLGDGKNKFGLFFGNLNNCTYEEKTHRNNLLVMGDNGNYYYSLLGASDEVDDFKIEDEKCLLSLTLDKQEKNFTFLNVEKNIDFTIPCDLNTDSLYFCLVLSAGGASVEIK